MKKILLIIFLAFFLQACATTTTPFKNGDNRTVQMITSDQRIVTTANEMLSANQDLSTKAHIVVASYNGVVLLAGQTPTADLRTQAVAAVQKVPNIRRIFNEITVGKPTSMMQRSKDAGLTTAVKARMITTSGFNSSQVKVVTENAIVYLMGLTTPNQADMAGKIARSTNGVKRVVRLIEYYLPADNKPTNIK
jgi:osmotically-inducible protein OsmY